MGSIDISAVRKDISVKLQNLAIPLTVAAPHCAPSLKPSPNRTVTGFVTCALQNNYHVKRYKPHAETFGSIMKYKVRVMGKSTNHLRSV